MMTAGVLCRGWEPVYDFCIESESLLRSEQTITKIKTKKKVCRLTDDKLASDIFEHGHILHGADNTFKVTKHAAQTK